MTVGVWVFATQLFVFSRNKKRPDLCRGRFVGGRSLCQRVAMYFAPSIVTSYVPDAFGVRAGT